MNDQIRSSTEARAPGAIISQHQLKRDVERRATLLLILSLLIFLAASIWSVYRWYFAFTRFGPAVVWRWSAPAIAISLIALILAFYAGFFLIRNRKRYIYTTPEGLWLADGRDHRALRWSDISSLKSSASKYIWSTADHSPYLRISVTTLEGENLKLPAFFTALNDLHQVIKKNIYPQAMNRYRERMKSGQPLEFGPLQLTRSGVAYRNLKEPWQNFQNVNLERGRLIIEFQGSKRSRRISIPSRRVPNIDLCVQLLRNIEY